MSDELIKALLGILGQLGPTTFLFYLLPHGSMKYFLNFHDTVPFFKI